MPQLQFPRFHSVLENGTVHWSPAPWQGTGGQPGRRGAGVQKQQSVKGWRPQMGEQLLSA